MGSPVGTRAVSVLAVAWALVACGSPDRPNPSYAPPLDASPDVANRTGDASTLDGGADAGPTIGTPCAPAQELATTFTGFLFQEQSELQVPSGDPTCFVFHFQGLVTCPYGQNAAGQAPDGGSPCTTTDGKPVAGAVEPQCTNRRASQVVLWSCRCANVEGATNDGDVYCACPSGTTCAQEVTNGGSLQHFSGGYCLPPSIVPDAGASVSCDGTCDPTTAPCP
jgi:hypothetical protein